MKVIIGANNNYAYAYDAVNNLSSKLISNPINQFLQKEGEVYEAELIEIGIGNKTEKYKLIKKWD